MTSIPARPEAPGAAARPAFRTDLEAVFRDQYARVVGIARRVLGSPQEAEDVAQEVFLAFGRASVRTAEAPGWLAAAAAHTALNRLRSDARRSRRESATAVPERVPDVAEQVLADASRARVRAALARLPRRQALVVVLRHSGLSYQEVAGVLGLAVGSVGTTLRRGEAALRKELDRDETPA